MQRICVFCGSSPGKRPEYLNAARQLGKALVRQNLGLVYGGAKVGMMGQVAQAVFEQGGEVIGVIPETLANKDVAFTELADLRIVHSMHERKALMAELADGFIALPGGFGTIEELFEALTWAQLGFHHKPCGLLNVAGYYDRLLDFLNHIVQEGFFSVDYRALVLVDDTPDGLLRQFRSYQPPHIDKAAWALQMLKTE